jgi:C4-dicarboxylate-specific signal transduction histidine kinase
MGSEKVRLILAALLLLAAGATAALAGSSARVWVGAVALLIVGIAAAWPLTRSRASVVRASEPPPAQDARRLATLQAQLEHLPVAAWLIAERRALQPLSSRARRLAAPGGVRDVGKLNQLLSASERSGPVILETERGTERWQLQRQALAIDGQQQALLVLVPLEAELESESLHAWQQLLQVLTHEIMNSLTPIKSLSQTALGLLEEPDTAAELRTALDAIARRSEHLSSFVTNYRKVTQWPAPTMAPVDLQALFNRLQQAVGRAWTTRGGEATFELASPTLRLLADDGQLEQVLLALIQNAEQATADQSPPRLWVQARQSRGGRLQIVVRDNGPGVPAGMERQIFLPFFSAREGGHGIGLTVVRQLMVGMGGRVRHVRPLERGAAFVLSF